MPDIFIDQDPPENIPKPEIKTAENPEVKVEKTESIEEESTKDILPHSKSELLHSLGIKSHGGRLSGLSAYFEDPSKVKFNNMMENEILLLFLRKHNITNLTWILKAIALALIPIIFEFLSSFGFYSNDFVSPTGKFIIYGFYYFFIFSSYIFVNYMTWFYNISLVTNIRVIDIDYSEIVFENVDATKLSQVEDVGYKQIGIFRSIFDYGDVHLQTAGTASNFEFLSVPHPENVIRIINHLLGKKNHD